MKGGSGCGILLKVNLIEKRRVRFMAETTVLLPEGELRVARCDMLDKLISIGDGDAALLYLYILRNGDSADHKAMMRSLHMPKERFERALFTLNGLTAPAVAPKAEEKINEAPKYNADELRRARIEDHRFSAVCQSAEDALGRTLTESQLRCLLTAYDHLGLSAEAIIELLSYLKEEKGVVRLADIRKETYLWADMGIVSASDAHTYIARKTKEKPLSEAIYLSLGAKAEEPSPKEQRVASFALSHGFPPEAVTLAVKRTEKQRGQRSLDYTLGILRQWDAKNVHTASEITALEPEMKKAAGQTNAAPTAPEVLSAWEEEWLSRVKKSLP